MMTQVYVNETLDIPNIIVKVATGMTNIISILTILHR
jgi:hypothetical protein